MGKKFEEVCLPCQMEMGVRKKDCIPFQGYLTPEEEEAFSTFRRLKVKSQEIRHKIWTIQQKIKLAPQGQSRGGLHNVQEGLCTESSVYFEQLEKLRKVWKEWEARREEANRRKMAILGYGP
jgi:hypothetical protein